MKKNHIGRNVIIKEGVKLGNNVIIEDDVLLDYNVIVRDNVTIKKGTTVGANCILGEWLKDFYEDREEKSHPLIIGSNSIIRSGTIIYGDTQIGNLFQTGHNVTIREESNIGESVSIGTLSDIQGDCKIGNHVRIHSNVFVAPKSCIEDYVWIFPCAVLTDDPTPPSYQLAGVQIQPFAVICAGSVLLPGIKVASDSLVAAGAVVTRNVEPFQVVAGNPAKVIGDIREIKNKFTNENVYPWRETFKRGMPWEESDYFTWLKEQEERE